MASPAQPSRDRALTRLVPITGWLPNYQRAWFAADLIAGLTVAALVIPKAIGYASLSQAPVEAGLYAAAAGTIIYGLFGTCRQISTGPSSAPGAVAGAAVVTIGSLSENEAAQIVAGITIAVGVIFVVMRLLRMGWIASFISKAVIVGFLFGAGIDVAVGELKNLTGTKSSGDNAVQKLHSWVAGLSGNVHGLTIVIGVIALATLFGLHLLAPRLPGTLLVVALGILAEVVFGLGQHGVKLIGTIPSGLPSPAIPNVTLIRQHIGDVLVAAVGIVMIGFSQSAGDARHFAFKHGYRVDVDQESLSQGLANLGSGLIHGIPVSTSLSASSLNDNAGAKSQAATLWTGLVVLLTMIFLAPLFEKLPKPVLGAVIIEAVVFGMMDVRGLQRLSRVSRFDFSIALLALLGCLVFGVLEGILIGVGLSILWLVWRSASPGMPELGRVPGTTAFRSLEEHAGYERFPGLTIVRLDGGLFFATADAFADRVRALKLSDHEEAVAVVIDCSSMDFIDTQGSQTLGELAAAARATNSSLRLARPRRAVRELLARDGVLEAIGTDHIHLTVQEAVEAALAERA